MELNLNSIKGLFLLILAVSANFVGNLLGCKTQKLLTENMFAKHIVLMLLIYFTVDLTSDKINHPIDTLKLTVELWVFYVLFTKLDMTFTMIIFSLLCGLYVSSNYLNYLKKKVEKTDQEVQQLKTLETLLPMVSKLIIIVLIIGAVKYYLKQKKDHKKKFKHSKFFFGTTVCDSLK
tara:strand:+ start:54 stop:584 length:531 start_codon:yes stop_codon:yes gene_type:complete